MPGMTILDLKKSTGKTREREFESNFMNPEYFPPSVMASIKKHGRNHKFLGLEGKYRLVTTSIYFNDLVVGGLSFNLEGNKIYVKDMEYNYYEASTKPRKIAIGILEQARNLLLNALEGLASRNRYVVYYPLNTINTEYCQKTVDNTDLRDIA